jgi:hypothetical protein
MMVALAIEVVRNETKPKIVETPKNIPGMMLTLSVSKLSGAFLNSTIANKMNGHSNTR